MSGWEKAITEGNSAHQNGHWKLAIARYQQAMLIAKQDYLDLLEQDAHKALAKVLIVFFNSADTYVCSQQYQLANQQFEACFKFLEQQFVSVQLTQDFYEAALGAYSQARKEWFLFKQKNMGQETIIEPPSLRRIETQRLCLLAQH